MCSSPAVLDGINKWWFRKTNVVWRAGFADFPLSTNWQKRKSWAFDHVFVLSSSAI